MNTVSAADSLRGFIRKIENFPISGVTFFDCTPLFANGTAFKDAICRLAEPFESAGIDAVLGAEARGFFLAPALALRLGAGFVPARRPGKLPFRTRRCRYVLDDTEGIVDAGGFSPSIETSTYAKPYDFELHEDGILSGQRVLVVDDLLAKGGTAAACCQMVEEAGATVVACAFLIELVSLRGADQLKPRRIYSLLRY